MITEEVKKIVPEGELILEGAFFKKYSSGILLFWDAVGSFFVHPNGDVSICRKKGVPDGIIDDYLHGPVISVSYYMKGNLVLHGSCIQIGQHVVGFMGNSGMGKSTLSNALIKRGHQLIVDDNIVIDSYNPVKILPGVSRLRLWEDALIHFNEDYTSLQKVHPEFNKHIILLPTSIDKTKAVVLDKLFILQYNRTQGLVQLEGMKTLTELIAQCKGTHYLEGVREVANLQQCAKIASQIPVYHLKRKRGLKHLDDICKLIEDSLQSK